MTNVKLGILAGRTFAAAADLRGFKRPALSTAKNAKIEQPANDSFVFFGKAKTKTGHLQPAQKAMSLRRRSGTHRRDSNAMLVNRFSDRIKRGRAVHEFITAVLPKRTVF